MACGFDVSAGSAEPVEAGADGGVAVGAPSWGAVCGATGAGAGFAGTGANAGMVRQNGAEYVGEEAVKAELLWARRLCVSRGWPVIDVTRRSIEETAATVLQLMDAWHERQAKAMQAAPTA